MINKTSSFILILSVLLVFTNISSASIINLEYTEGIRGFNTTIDSTTYINIPAGNIIDSIELKPTFLTLPGEYNCIISYYINDMRYEDNFNSEISASFFHIFSNKYDYNIRHECNEDLQYHKHYETYISKFCNFPITITSYYGSHSEATEEQITTETSIFGHTGIKRATDIYSVYNAKSYAPRNFTIDHTGFSEMDIVIWYKIEGLHTTEFYIGQLSPTLKNLYKLGFAWVDKELYILNLFIISDKLIYIIMFWFGIIAKSFVPLTFIVITFVIPMIAYYNSNTRKSFITNMTVYYSGFFSAVLSFIRYIVMITLRVLETVRGMIPFF